MRRILNSGCLIRLTAVGLAGPMCPAVFVALAGARPNTRAVILMGTGLIVLWILIGGLAMRAFRDPLRRIVLGIRLPWRLKFVLFATCLALAEEAVTTAMTNLAPWFGVPMGSAYITASDNYLDVVCLHSVVVFIPMFICWSILLGRFRFSPNAVFLLFGLTGLTAEAMYGGPQAFAEFGLWIFVYGLMVYLPAYTIPDRPDALPPCGWHYGLAVFLPVLFAIPVAAIVGAIHPIRVHFPPILPDT